MSRLEDWIFHGPQEEDGVVTHINESDEVMLYYGTLSVYWRLVIFHIIDGGRETSLGLLGG